MIRNLIRYGALAGVMVGLGACDLDVRNPNDPSTLEVLASPLDAESLLGSYYRRWHAGLYTGTGNINGIAGVMSLENYSSLANNGLNARAGIPRPANDNNVSNVTSGEQQRVYYILGEVTRVATNILNATNETGFSIGASEARKLRMQAFGEFLRGVSLGYVALFYDSAGVVSAEMAGDDPGALVGYTEVMDSALAALDRAIVHTNASVAATGTDGFPIPQDWIPTTSTLLDGPGFVQLIRSYKARLRANIARTPAERAAVNWTEVIADATNGITEDHNNITSTTQGPFYSWMQNWQSRGLWHQMSPFFIGMADNQSSNYEDWIALSLGDRPGGFFLVSSDLRFPQGATRAAQQADFLYTSCDAGSTTCERYFVNRPANEDQTAGLSWGQSNYDWIRARSWAVNGDGSGARNGPITFMTKAEMDLLAAEGHIRSGAAGYASAAALINNTRTAGMVGGVATGGGLPAVTATANGGVTGAGCIPEIPVNASNNGGGTVSCAGDLPGDRGIFEAMKYEKRMETAYTHFAAWYLDHRGWGDMPEGTPLQWATPYQDLQARQRPIYSISGAGSGAPVCPGAGCNAAGPSTYGW